MRKFKDQIEDIVAPIRATEMRKARMREELLGHLLDLFKQERARLAPEDSMAQALRRLGKACSIRRELQASVPAAERLLFARVPLLTRTEQWTWLKRKEGQSVESFAFKLAVVYTLGPALLIWLCCALTGQSWLTTLTFPLILGVNVFFLCCGGEKAHHALAGERGARRRIIPPAIGVLLGLLVFVSGLLATCLLLRSFHVYPQMIQLWLGVAGSTPIAFLVACKLTAIERGRLARWNDLTQASD